MGHKTLHKVNLQPLYLFDLNLNHFIPCSYWSSHHSSFLTIPQHARNMPVLGPLHSLFLLPGTYFPDVHVAQYLTSFKSSLK